MGSILHHITIVDNITSLIKLLLNVVIFVFLSKILIYFKVKGIMTINTELDLLIHT